MSEDAIVRPEVGSKIRVAVGRDDPCPYIVTDNVLITHLKLTHDIVGLEVSVLATQNSFAHQEATIDAVEGDNITASPGGFTGSTQPVHKATLRMHPLTALDAAAAILQHLRDNDLVTGAAMSARLKAAGFEV